MILPASRETIPMAVEMLARGLVVALPTETVYGLAADAGNDDAVRAIYHIKKRPIANPLIVHVSNVDMARDFVDIDPLSQRLIDCFWPGPLTLVLPQKLLPQKKSAPISPLANNGLPTLALRQPQGIFADIIEDFGRPLVAPSANRSGRISPTCASAVEAELGQNVPLILDGGACSVGVESTILKVENDDIFMLRAGGLAREDIERLLSKPIKYPAPNSKIEAPGMLSSHYAPQSKLRLNVHEVKQGENLLAFGPHRASHYQRSNRILNLSEQGDLIEAANHLFDYLRQLDEGVTIAVEPIPFHGLGEAINDRLRRASAPRE